MGVAFTPYFSTLARFSGLVEARRAKAMMMKRITQKFQVSYQYPVYFTQGLFTAENDGWPAFLEAHREAGTRLLFVLDAGVTRAHPGLRTQIEDQLRSASGGEVPYFFLELPGGESVKNDPAHVTGLLSAINRHGLDRHCWVVAVGGGALLDVAGYAAAIAHRGVRHVRIPTTVLSQNDSGIGVKNGINYFGKKNFIGAFAPPFAVFNDRDFLTTLNDRQWRSGISEAVKVALIKDTAFFSWLEGHAGELAARDMGRMEELIYQCAALHLDHIASGDPFESGSSRPLDFGHWSAHKLEQLTDFALLHGEAVATGIALDTLYSRETGWLGAAEADRVLALLQRLGFSLFHPKLEDQQLIDGISEFREHLGGKLTVMMLRAIGQGENVHTMDVGRVKACIKALKLLPASPVASSATETF